MTNYEPNKLLAKDILVEINEIYGDIYMFLLEVDGHFGHHRLLYDQLKKEYDVYIKERYGERVFRSIVPKENSNLSNKENKKITKKVRSCEKSLTTVTYPITDLGFLEGKNMLELLFYEVVKKGCPVKER